MSSPSWRRNDRSHKERFVEDCSLQLQGRQFVLKQCEEPDMPVWDASIVLASFLLKR
jgi:hypothetical protein